MPIHFFSSCSNVVRAVCLVYILQKEREKELRTKRKELQGRQTLMTWAVEPCLTTS